jgi:UDPglucose--hexose-1-phosphate uridylyltransferase
VEEKPARNASRLGRDAGGKNTTKKNKISELRQDIVTGDWVLIATGRGKRPGDFAKPREPYPPLESECFFCFPEETGQEKDTLIFRRADGDWSLRVIPNKYPAFSKNQPLKSFEEGPYFAMNGVGFHELVITRDHHRQIALLDPIEVAEIVDAYQDRYISLMNKKSVNYIEIFHNHGREAGASVEHPHSQLMAIPVISPGVKLELDGAETFHKANRKCVFCEIAKWELTHKKRLVFENDNFLAFCPFSSRAAFEIWVMPKNHQPYFERITNEEKIDLGEALQKAIGSIYKTLEDPAYNFYLHTSPCDGKDYPHFHWHIEILPRTATWAGFELSTGIEISTIEPEVAAEELRESI